VTGSRVARRYARALLELAADQGQLEAWGAELERLAQVAGSRELMAPLTSPELSDEHRQEAMALLASRLDLSFPVRSFAVVVARHGRIADITAMAAAYQELLDQRLGRARATLTFPAQPDAADLAAALEGLERLSGKKIIPTVNLDPRLIGGVVAELEGRTYDASVARRLELLEQQLSR
jgi:F-type H+-transporting ATPase subunit delta